jgi:hypothetical protein
MEWKDHGCLFGTTFRDKSAFRLEKNAANQVRVVLHAKNKTLQEWEPVFATAPFENEDAYCQWINELVSAECAARDPELAVAYLLHTFLYGEDRTYWEVNWQYLKKKKEGVRRAI